MILKSFTSATIPPVLLLLLLLLTVINDSVSGLEVGNNLGFDPRFDGSLNLTDLDDTEQTGPKRFIEFQVFGLYRLRADSAPQRILSGEQVVSETFSISVMHNDRLLTAKTNPHRSDRKSIVLTNLSPEAQRFVSVFVIIKHPLLGSDTLTCSYPLEEGKSICNLTSTYYLAVVARERINLHDCEQSSVHPQSSTTRHCGIAYDEEFKPDCGQVAVLSVCVVTETESQPWWMAKTDGSYQFHTVEIEAASEFNDWTANFQVSVDTSVCVSVENEEPFVKKSFYCGGYGQWIVVRALSDNERLSICKIVAHGSPGGCGTIGRPIRNRPDNPDAAFSSCTGTLPGHIGLGKVPYPPGLNCQWTLNPPRRSEGLLLQFTQFGTIGPQDYVAIYEGKGVQGKLLAKFYGPAGSANAPAEYQKPGIFGAQNYLRTGNMTNQITVHFVSAPMDRWQTSQRTLESYPGFELKYTVVREDNILANGSESDFNIQKRDCPVNRYVDRLHRLCLDRGGINPIYLYGNETGGQMLKEMEFNNSRNALALVDVKLMQEKLGAMLYTQPEPDFEDDLKDSTVANWCTYYRQQPGGAPRYFDECCCSYCSQSFLSRYCLYGYAEAERCDLVDYRVNQSFQAQLVNKTAASASAADYASRYLDDLLSSTAGDGNRK